MISETKYSHRRVSHANYDRAIAELIPHRTNTVSLFHFQTLRSSCIKPFARNSNGKVVTKAGKEYFQHAGGLQVRFHELRDLAQNQLRRRLVESENGEDGGLMGRFVYWVTGVKAE